jgi:glycosyltransferase involved in cell wall biosynthesis/SAM-dependent methyltransferase
MNFRFVLFEAASPYFMWAAADDCWGPGFIEQTLAFLESNPDYVCCQGRVIFTKEGWASHVATGTFALTGSWRENVAAFLSNPADNSRFYGLFRTAALQAVYPRRSFFSLDWAVSSATLLYGKHAELPDILMIRDSSDDERYQLSVRREYTFFLWRMFPFLFATIYCLRRGYIGFSARNLHLLLKLNFYLAVRFGSYRFGQAGERYIESHDLFYAIFGRRMQARQTLADVIGKPVPRALRHALRMLWHILPLSPGSRQRVRNWVSVRRRSFVRRLERVPEPAEEPEAAAVPDANRAPETVPADPVLPSAGWQVPVVTDGVAPAISIIIATDAVISALALINSIAEAQDGLALQVVVCDCGSSDITNALLSRCKQISYIRCESGLRYGAVGNRAITLARAPLIGFFHQRTLLTPGGLRLLLHGMKETVAIVGPKVIYGDGRICAAGGIVDRDDGVYGFGRLGDQRNPSYLYSRVVDFCPDGYVVRSALLHESGGFDSSIRTFELASVDLALRLRANGYQCLYYPRAALVSYSERWGKTINYQPPDEWLNDLTDLYQKHAFQINDMRERAQPGRRYDRTAKGRVLYIDAETPMPDRNSGSIDALNMLRILTDLGFRVTFIPESNFLHRGSYTEALQESGVEVIYHPFNSTVQQVLERETRDFDVVVLCRVYIAEKYVALVRECAPAAKIVFNTVDLHFLRLVREAALLRDEALAVHAEEVRIRELRVINDADVTIVLSLYEAELVKRELPRARVRVVPLLRQIPDQCDAPGFESRADIIFVGTYQHPPNCDAVIYFVREIWPRIRREIPGVRFFVVGSEVTKDVEALSGDGVEVLGFVKDLTPLLRGCRLSVAPLRYGAGLKGKIATSLQAGLPCVSTSIGAEGAGLTDGKELLIADGREAFVDAVVRLYNDPGLWSRLSREGFEYTKRSLSIESNVRRVADLLSEINAYTPQIEQVLFERDLAEAKFVCQPSMFWEHLGGKNRRFLDEAAIGNFKRTINNTYYQWLPGSFRNAQLEKLLAFFQKRPDMMPVEVVASSVPSRVLSDVQVSFGDNPFLQSHYLEFYSFFVGLLWYYVACNDPTGLHRQLEEPTLGNPLPVRLGRKLISQDLANSLDEWLRVRTLTENARVPAVPRVLEVGAGYGRLAFVFMRAQKCKYIIVDIAPALFLARWYLERALPGLKIFGYRTFTSYDDVKSEFDEADLCVIGPHQLELLPDEYVDICVSISSLHEMTRDQIQYYKTLIERKTKTAVYFKQWNSWKNPIDGILVGRGDFLLQHHWSRVLDQPHPVNSEFVELGFLRDLSPM